MDPIFFYRIPEPGDGGAGAASAGAGPVADGGSVADAAEVAVAGEAVGDAAIDGVVGGAVTGGEATAGAATAGALTRLTIAIQPNISVRGWPTTAGSNALSGYVAPEDATVVSRLRGAGAYLCGSIHMSEFGLGLSGSRAGEVLRRRGGDAGRSQRDAGQMRNGGPGESQSDALDARPGGVDEPAGGAGRSHAADAELVLDFMGESRLAAARAGACSLKPSYGLVSRLGLVGLIPSMESCGLLAPEPQTIRAVLQAIAGRDGLDYSLPDEEALDFSPRSLDPETTTIGIIAESRDLLSAEQGPAFNAALAELEQAGFASKELSLPDFSLFSLVHRIVGSVEASSATGRYDSVRYGLRAPGAKNWNEMYLLSRGAAFGTLLKSYLIQGAFLQFERYAAFEDACRLRARLVAEMQRLAAQVDFLALPLVDGAAAAGGAAAGGGDSLAGLYAQFASTLFANVTGQPALYLPPMPEKAHLGLQFTGPRLSDARLLALGEHLLATRGGE